jgi:hypothetical protein
VSTASSSSAFWPASWGVRLARSAAPPPPPQARLLFAGGAEGGGQETRRGQLILHGGDLPRQVRAGRVQAGDQAGRAGDRLLSRPQGGDPAGQARLGVGEMLQGRRVPLGRLSPDEGLGRAAAREHGVVGVGDQPEQAGAGLQGRPLGLLPGGEQGPHRLRAPGRGQPHGPLVVPGPGRLVLAEPPQRLGQPAHEAGLLLLPLAGGLPGGGLGHRHLQARGPDRQVLGKIRGHLLQAGGPIRAGQLQQADPRRGVQARGLDRGRHRGADGFPGLALLLDRGRAATVQLGRDAVV